MTEHTTPQTTSLLERRIHTLGSHSPLFYDTPLELVSGRGVWVKSASGARYLDAYNNVPHVGHAHPEVANAVSKQMRKLAINSRYLNDRVVAYAEALLASHHGSIDRVSFSNSGSEANELAIRVARFSTGNTGMILSDFSYHGTTLALAQATSALDVSEQRGKNVRMIRIPDATGLADEQSVQLLADSLAEVDAAIASLQKAGFGVAATLFDPLFTTEGLPKPPAGYIEGLVERVHRAGGLYIADEVQSGFGRIGRLMWGYELFDAVPDIVTMGNPMGNGHPLAAAVMRAELLEAFGAANMYFNTFGGNPVSAAAGHAVLDVMAEEDLRSKAADTGAFINGELARELTDHPRVADVRGDGLFAGVLIMDPDTGRPDAATAKRVVEGAYRSKVLISRLGRDGNMLKIRPPLAFQREHAEVLLSKLTKVVHGL